MSYFTTWHANIINFQVNYLRCGYRMERRLKERRFDETKGEERTRHETQADLMSLEETLGEKRRLKESRLEET